MRHKDEGRNGKGREGKGREGMGREGKGRGGGREAVGRKGERLAVMWLFAERESGTYNVPAGG